MSWNNKLHHKYACTNKVSKILRTHLPILWQILLVKLTVSTCCDEMKRAGSSIDKVLAL